MPRFVVYTIKMAFTGVENPNLPNIAQPQQRAEVYKFTTDELRVLKQCNIDSFYQRCLPIASFLGLGSYYGVKAGYLRGHPKFGAVPKTCVAVIAGYFIGKLSYQQKCAEKLMALPDSKLGEALRQRRRQGISENISLDTGFSAPIGFDTSVPVSDEPPRQSSLDIDTDRPLLDFYTPAPQAESYDVSAIPVPPGGVPSTSYDELRRKNREDYDAQRSRPYSYRPVIEQPVVDEAAPIARSRPSTATEPSRQRPKNKYGDEWEQ